MSKKPSAVLKWAAAWVEEVAHVVLTNVEAAAKLLLHGVKMEAMEVMEAMVVVMEVMVDHQEDMAVDKAAMVVASKAVVAMEEEAKEAGEVKTKEVAWGAQEWAAQTHGDQDKAAMEAETIPGVKILAGSTTKVAKIKEVGVTILAAVVEAGEIIPVAEMEAGTMATAKVDMAKVEITTTAHPNAEVEGVREVAAPCEAPKAAGVVAVATDLPLIR